LVKKNFDETSTSYVAEGDNPRGRAFYESYSSAQAHHGVGLQVINDRTGPLNRFAAYATYAFHKGISPTTSISAGLGAGITNISLNSDKLQFNTTVDPSVSGTGTLNQLKPDLMAGVYFYSRDWFAGISAQQIIPQKIMFSDGAVTKVPGKQVPHIFVTGGYRVLMGDNFNLIPSVLVKYVNPTPVQADFNAKLQYRDKAWIGATLRTGDGFAGMAGLYISPALNVGYAYDYSISRINTFSKGTHEILIGFIIGNPYPDSCPKNVW
jgi:type IX secretion system PorP/SprF family membrane protein